MGTSPSFQEVNEQGYAHGRGEVTQQGSLNLLSDSSGMLV